MNIEIKEHTLHKRFSLIMLSFIIFLAFSLFGYNGGVSNYIKFALFAFWIALVVLNSSMLFHFSDWRILAVLWFVFYYVVTCIFHGDIMYTMKWAMMYIMQYGAIFAYYIFARYSIENKKTIITATFCIWILVTLCAFIFYLKNPGAGRMLASDSSAFDNIAIGNGYSLAYGSALLVPFLCWYLLNYKVSTKRKMLLYLSIVLLIATVYLTESTTTLIAMFTGIICTYMVRVIFGKNHETVHDSKRKLFGWICFIVLIIVVLLNLRNIGNFICEVTQDKIDVLYMRRFYRIGEKLSHFGSFSQHNYVDDRWSTVTYSLSTFFENMFLGVGYKFGNIYSAGYGFGVGQHSEYADLLAQFGLFGGLPMLLCYLSNLKDIFKKSGNEGLIIAMLILGIFNPFQSFQSCYMFFFFIPTVIDYLMQTKGKVG